MTTQISWIGVDHRAPSSVYIATDSRISWGASDTWDAGKKVFNSTSSPQIWGYSGDVLFPSQAIGSFVHAYDCGAFQKEVGFSEVSAHAAFVASLKKQYEGYPDRHRRDFSIIHCARIAEGMKTQFAVWKTSWDRGRGWQDLRITPPSSSDLIQVEGSGKKTFTGWNMRLKKSEIGSTSRAVFQAFTQSIRSESDPLTFGPPQLVALRRRGSGLAHGIIWDNKVWLNGTEVSLTVTSELECYNENFERCNPATGKLLAGAQRQPLPKLPTSP
jgi:hypothetical protein